MARRPHCTTSQSDPTRTTMGSVGQILRRSPRSVAQKNYQETRARWSASSSADSTGHCGTNPVHLKASLEITYTNEHGETQFVGSGVFTLPPTVRLDRNLFDLNLRTPKVTPPDQQNVAATNVSIEEIIPLPVTFDYVGYLARQRICDKKLRKYDHVINKLVDKYASLKQNEAEYEKLKLEEARNYRRKMRGETFGVVKEPQFEPFEKVKIVHEDPFAQVHTLSSPCSGGPSA